MGESAYQQGSQSGLKFTREVKEEEAEDINFDALFEKILFYILSNDVRSNPKIFIKEKDLRGFVHGFFDTLLSQDKFKCIRAPYLEPKGSKEKQLAKFKVLAKYVAFKIRAKMVLCRSLNILLHSQIEIKVTPFGNFDSITSFSIFDCNNNKSSAARTSEDDKLSAAADELVKSIFS